MPLDPLAGLGLLGQLIETIVSAITRARGTSKQRFGKGLIALYGILDDVDTHVTAIVSSLQQLVDGSVGSRSLHHMVRNFDELELACARYFHWIDKHDEWRKALEVFAPDKVNTLQRLAKLDILLASPIDEIYYGNSTAKEFSFTIVAIRAISLQLRNDSQSMSEVTSIIRQMNTLRNETQRAKMALRDFAITSLTIEDVF